MLATTPAVRFAVLFGGLVPAAVIAAKLLAEGHFARTLIEFAL